MPTASENQLAELATELVQHPVDAIVVFSGPAIVAAKAATTSIPILFFTGFDPVQSGFVASLNRPGGNVTGVSVLNTELLAKRLQVLCELIPSAKSIAFLYSPVPSGKWLELGLAFSPGSTKVSFQAARSIG